MGEEASYSLNLPGGLPPLLYVKSPDPLFCTGGLEVTASNQLYHAVMGVLTLMVPVGLTMIEAGNLPSTTTTSLLMKSLVTIASSAVGWFVCGFAFGLGEGDDIVGNNYFIGNSGPGMFAMSNLGRCEYGWFFYQWAMCATATTVVFGAVAGRTQVATHVIFSMFYSGVIYPVVVHWFWGYDRVNWLQRGSHTNDLKQRNIVGGHDFSGAACVSVLGGSVTLLLAIFIGRRTGFDRDKHRIADAQHSTPLIGLGTCLFIFGSFGMNAGSVRDISDTRGASEATLVIVNTALSLAGGVLGALFILKMRKAMRRREPFWSLSFVSNCGLGGIVAITGGANIVWPWAAFVIGLLAAMTVYLWSQFVRWRRVDDLRDAVAVHLGCGLWGMLTVPMFSFDKIAPSIFYDDFSSEAWKGFAWAGAAAGVTLVWGCVLGLAMVCCLNCGGCLGLRAGHQENSDKVEHGKPAYVYDQYMAVEDYPAEPLGPTVISKV